VYVQGANTSLPEDVQLEMLRTIPALRRVQMIRVGYAIEYDYVPPSQTSANLESKTVPGLFFAGQINGTTGYEEAAGQGLIAGINAALKVKGKPALLIRRDQGYLGVMIDDLVTRELHEPYRLLTCRAEYRLLLRQDNADLRLCPVGYELGLVSRTRYEVVEAKRVAVAGELQRLAGTYLSLNQKTKESLESYGLPLNSSISAVELLRRQNVGYGALMPLGLGNADLAPEAFEQVEIEAKYGGYIRQQQIEVDRLGRLETKRIPDNFDYDSMPSLRHEARQKLNRFRPLTLGQASRIDGVTPADLSILIVYLERARRGSIGHSRPIS
jgi:tRNA uridine 5-carboxymethylaminomethyl modification enzyme